MGMSRFDRFMEELARGVIAAGAAREDDIEGARALAAEAWKELKRIGDDAYPCMLDMHGVRYVYQWDENPPVIAVMLWDDQMWRNMAMVTVPEVEQ